MYFWLVFMNLNRIYRSLFNFIQKSSWRVGIIDIRVTCRGISCNGAICLPLYPTLYWDPTQQQKLFILPVKHSIEILIAFAWFAFQVNWIEIDKVLEFWTLRGKMIKLHAISNDTTSEVINERNLHSQILQLERKFGLLFIKFCFNF